MRVFVTGASGWIGSAVTEELLAHGHQVLGLARSTESAARIEAAGAAVLRGSLDDLDSLAAGAAETDGVVHLGFKHDFSDMATAWRTEHAAVQRMLDVLEGTGKPILIASGMPAPEGGLLTEQDVLPFHGPESMRGGGENLALSYAGRGVRPVAMRFSPTVHGHRDHGFVAFLTDLARKHGVAGYIGDGSTVWSAVHRDDAAVLVRLALEQAPAGSRVHAIAETTLSTRDIAAAIGESLGLPTKSLAPEEVEPYFGWIAGFYGINVAGTNEHTRELLGWTPVGPTLFEDIAAGAYTNSTYAQSQ
ncbi:SDR family oxidoreductase [Pseudonocardiaceae bacterium YIM PH 21723]|nr:SDR family oxidoreductase [Pseudonocardiaceae bacterium YIM PH 21723]